MTDTELRVLAEAATPGPWKADVFNVCDRVSPPPTGPIWGSHVWIGPYSHYIPSEHEQIGERLSAPTPDAAYIAAVSPDVILALLDRCEKAEAALKSCTTICDKCGGYVPAAEVCDCQFSVKRIETVLVACGHEPPARIRDLARLACTALLEGER
jgi:hypothetical protein